MQFARGKVIAFNNQIIKFLGDHAKESGLYSGNDLDHEKVFNRVIIWSDLLFRKVTLLIMWKIEWTVLEGNR